jgi:hypothetical protein
MAPTPSQWLQRLPSPPDPYPEKGIFLSFFSELVILASKNQIVSDKKVRTAI